MNRAWVRGLRFTPDTAERHAIVAQQLLGTATVLDVGGVEGQLAPFLPRVRVTTINVNEDGRLRFDGAALPFADDSHDAAVSLDVLEHIPPESRAEHFAELLRVARRRVVVCCPWGSTAHRAAEEKVSAWYEQITGAAHPFLSEHATLGLPDAATIAELERRAEVASWTVMTSYHGDFRSVDAQFRTAMLARRGRRPTALARYAIERLRFRPELSTSSEPSAWTNRVYVTATALPAT